MNYKTLPKGYQYAGTLDFMRNRDQIRSVLKLAAMLIATPLIIGVAVTIMRPSILRFLRNWKIWLWIALMLVAYIPLHELVHGAVMFALTGVKPNFGIKLPYAWAGSTAWFDRKSHVITALAPMLLWGVVLLILIFALPEKWFWPLWIVQISNLSGSAGDIYCVQALLKMDGELLIQDTGTRMRIMRYVES